MAVWSTTFTAGDGQLKDGVAVKLWTLAQFDGTQPAQDTALPTSAAVQTGTTGVAHGGAGAIRFSGVATGSYVISFSYNGSIVYESFDVVAAPFVDVTDYGAVGDGVTDDTGAVNTALADTTVGVVYFPPGTYKWTNPVIANRTGLVLEGQGATILVSGTGTSGTPRGLTFSGTNRDITIRNLRFLGDATAANYHAGVKVPTGVSIEGLRIRDCHFEDLALGVYVNSASGTLLDFLVDSCEFENIVGVGSSQGRGVYVSYTTGQDMNLVVRDSDFETTNRSAIQVASAIFVTISGNTFRNHRSGTATLALVPVVDVNAGENIRIVGNRFCDYSDGGIAVTPSGSTIKRVQIEGNTFDDPANAISAMTLGSSDPGASGTIESLQVRGNQLYQTGVTCAGLILYSGLYVNISDNTFQIESLAGTTYAFDLVGAGESAGTSVYTDEVRLVNNSCLFTLSGGTGYGIRLRNDVAPVIDQLFATSNIAAYFTANSFPGATTNFLVDASVNSPGIVVTGMRKTGLTFTSTQGLLRMDTGPLLFGGGQILGYRAITATTTLTDRDHVVAADATAGSITVNLPTAVGIDGTVYTILKTDLSAFGVTIDPSGTQTIDGQLARAVNLDYEGITIIAVGGNWRTLHASRGIHTRRQYRHSAATSINITYEDDILSVDSTSGAVTINLPAIAGMEGWGFRVIRSVATNTITLDGNGAETIYLNGTSAATQVITATVGRWVDVIAGPTEWKITGGLYA